MPRSSDARGCSVCEGTHEDVEEALACVGDAWLRQNAALKNARNNALETAAARVEELRRTEGIGLDAQFFAAEIRKLKTT